MRTRPAIALTIDNPETEKLAHELARRRGQDVTQALTEVLRREVGRERRKPRREPYEEFSRRIEEIVEQFNKLPVLDDRSPDEIGYKDQGLFDRG